MTIVCCAALERGVRWYGAPTTGPAHESRATVSITEAVSKTLDSVRALARAFGSPVFEPAWWPADAGEISYCLERFPHGDYYRVGSTRHNDVPTCVMGHPEVPVAGRAAGEWYAPRELTTVRGLIGRVGIPPRLQAVVLTRRSWRSISSAMRPKTRS
jgi:hypothetical protein